ncbi:MAG: sugar phosphate isomerase/epimerase family protein [Rhodothermales bacterium]
MNDNAYSRRDFLHLTAGGVTAAFAATTMAACGESDTPAVSVAAMATAVPIGVQLYCFRHLMEKDVPGTLTKVAELGFTDVEFAGHFEYTAEETRKMLTDNGLNAVSTHLGIDPLLGDELEKTVAYNQTIGNNNLIVAGISKERSGSKDGLMRTIDDFVAISDKLRPLGMKTGYHCHAYSFSQLFDGTSVWDLIADNTPDDFILQLDTGNASAGGADLAAVLKGHPGRIASMHIKPYTIGSDDPFNAFIGEDSTDWPTIMNLSESVGGVESYIIEYEHEGHPPLEALQDNLTRFSGMKRA